MVEKKYQEPTFISAPSQEDLQLSESQKADLRSLFKWERSSQNINLDNFFKRCQETSERLRRYNESVA